MQPSLTTTEASPPTMAILLAQAARPCTQISEKICGRNKYFYLDDKSTLNNLVNLYTSKNGYPAI
jgi:hypothetical protein